MAIAFVSAVEKDTTTIPANGNETDTSASFTPAAGELLVLKIGPWDGGITINTVSDSTGLTWTQRAAAIPANNTNTQSPAYIYTATVATSAAMTVSVAYTSVETYVGRASFVVERWTGAQLAATPATNTSLATTTTSSSITSTVANSVITWCGVDYTAAAGTVTYLSGATQSGALYSSGNYAYWSAYQTAATVGAQTYGLSSPSSTNSTFAALEIIPKTAAAVTEADTTPRAARAVGEPDVAFGGPVTLLQSDFRAMPSFFDGNFGGANVAGGQLHTPTVGSYAAATPAYQRFSLVSSQVFVQVVQASGASGTRQNSIKCIIDANNSVEMLYGGGTFTGRVQKNGTNTDLTLPAYNATSHQWWRMRESGGTVFWDGAPDGVTWTNLGSATHGLNLQSVKVNLQAGYYGTETAPPDAIWDNLNWTAVADTAPAAGRAVDAVDTYVIGVNANTALADTPATARAVDQADAAAIDIRVTDTSEGLVRVSGGGPDALLVGVVVADGSEGVVRVSGGGPDALLNGVAFADTAGVPGYALRGALDVVSQDVRDPDPGGASQVQAVGAADTVAIGQAITDPAAGLVRASGPADAVTGGGTIVETQGAPARTLNVGDAAAIGVTDAELAGSSQVQAVGAVDAAAIGFVFADTPGTARAADPVDAAAVGVTLTDGGGLSRAAGQPDTDPGGLTATFDPPFQPVRAVWSPDVAAIQASSSDVAGVPVRALGAGDYLANSGSSADPSVGASRALNAPDVTPRVDVVAADTSNGIVRLWAQNDAWSAYATAFPGDYPGATTFPGASAPAVGLSRLDTFTIAFDGPFNAPRALGTPVGMDVVVGATSGALSNLPILRVLADFTQGPPNQPASTAGGTTVELTQSLAATAVTVRRGRQYELGKPQAGTATITFSDPQELLNPTNTSSPYNSGSASLVSYRPMRVTAVWRGTLYTIYTGYIERYPQTWTDAGFRGVKPLECVDGLAMLANTSVHQSYYETIMADNPSIYIPYNESSAPAHVYVNSAKALLANGKALPGNPRQGTSTYYQTQLLVGGTALRVVPSASNGGQVSFGGDTMPDGTPALTLSSKAPDPTSTDTSRAVARVDTGGGTFSLNTAGSTIEFWFRWTVGVVNIGACESITDGEFDYPTNDAVIGLYTSGGRLYYFFKGTATGTAGGVEVSASFLGYTGVPDGQWHYAAMTFFPNSRGDGTASVTTTFDFSEKSFGTSYPTAQIGINSVHTHATSDYGDPESQVSVAQFAYYSTPLTQNQRITHASRGFGNAGESPVGRFSRLINTYWSNGGSGTRSTPDITPALDSDFVYGVYPVPGNSATTAATSQSFTVQQAVQMVDTAGQGLSYFTVAGVATIETRDFRIKSLTSLGTFGDRPGELPYTALEFDYDPTYVYTQTQITKAQGGQVIINDNATAKAIYGVRTFSDTIQLRDEFDLFQYGMHILSQYGTQRVRIRRIEIDPAAVGSDALWQIVLGLELSQRFTVNRRTANGTLFSHDYFVEQIEHQIDPAASTWKVRLQLSPVLYPSAPGVVGATGNPGTLGAGTVVTF